MYVEKVKHQTALVMDRAIKLISAVTLVKMVAHVLLLVMVLVIDAPVHCTTLDTTVKVQLSCMHMTLYLHSQLVSIF